MTEFDLARMGLPPSYRYEISSVQILLNTDTVRDKAIIALELSLFSKLK